MRKDVKVWFRRVRAAVYLGGTAWITAAIAAGDLPAWAAVPGAGLLLALLNLSPADVEPDDEP